MLLPEALMPLDYPPELVCTASCNNLDCNAVVGILCQYGDDKTDVEAKLMRQRWIVDGDAVYCSERCRVRSTVKSAASVVA
jgi:hypothetical protein